MAAARFLSGSSRNGSATVPDTTARTLRLAPALWQRLEAEARRQKRSVNNLIDFALDEFLDSQEYAREWKLNDRK